MAPSFQTRQLLNGDPVLSFASDVLQENDGRVRSQERNPVKFTPMLARLPRNCEATDRTQIKGMIPMRSPVTKSTLPRGFSPVAPLRASRNPGPGEALARLTGGGGGRSTSRCDGKHAGHGVLADGS